jgi:anthranilate synthase component 1
MVPVFRELLADNLTPVMAYAALAGDGPAFLLESVEGGERLGRYSFVAADPMAVLTIEGGELRVQDAGGRSSVEAADPLKAIEQYLAGFRAEPVEGLPSRFCGGAVGYFAYEAARYLERVPVPEADPLGVLDGILLLADTLVCFDHVQHRIKLISHVRSQQGTLEAAYSQSMNRIDALAERLLRPVQLRTLAPPEPGIGIKSTAHRSEAEFREAVLRAKELILSGDIYQVQIAQRFTAPVQAAPFDVYRVLRALNPSPYMYLLQFPGITVLGTSPEILVTVEGRKLRYRPIAGTRRRGRDQDADQRMEQELRSSLKEQAEHIMLVDL